VAGRVEAVDGVRSQSDAQPVRRVSVRVGEGQDAARVRVALQGEAVQAEMGTRSARLARQLGHELPELTRALQQHGMELDGLRVRQGDRVVADVITPRAAEAGRTPETGTSSRNEGSGTQTQRHAQDGRDRRRDSNQEGDE
jgi:flagellar hook-length control protein FliK